MNKRWMFFAMSLLLMVAVKHAFGQDEPVVGWDLEDDPTEAVAAVMIAAPILGTILGGLRLLTVTHYRPVTILGLRPDARLPGGR